MTDLPEPPSVGGTQGRGSQSVSPAANRYD